MKKIAKNLLEGKSCNNCIYSAGLDSACYYEADAKKNQELMKACPKENTCSKWKELSTLTFSVKTIKINKSPRKMKYKWSLEKDK